MIIMGRTFLQSIGEQISEGSVKATPVGEIVLIRPEIDDITPGGIVVSRGAREMPHKGTIIAINDVTSKKYGIQKGDRVVFNKHTQQMEPDESMTRVNAETVCAILE